MMGHCTGVSGQRLISSLTKLCSVMLKGEVPPDICPILYGASLCALKKKDGGIRPVAVGNTLRRLVAKLGSFHLRSILGTSLPPVQLGFGSKGGAEAAAHASRRFLAHDHTESKVFLKIDFLNAFNSVQRDSILQTVTSQMPELSPFLTQCYRLPSHLFFGDNLISSQRGIQQGDPLGPALFCAVVHPMASSLSSELNLWFLDDAALGGHPTTVLQDLKNITQTSKTLGLELNFRKCELFFLKTSVEDIQSLKLAFNEAAPNIRFPEPRECSLLGAPLKMEAIEESLQSKNKALKRIAERLPSINAHTAFFILKNSLAIPKLSYVLRCAPTWLKETSLEAFDSTLKETLEVVSNTSLSPDAWDQTELPVKLGGLGIRHATSLALPAFLASTTSVSSLVNSILPDYIVEEEDLLRSQAIVLWKETASSQTIPMSSSQKDWEKPTLDVSRANLLNRASTLQDKARLLGVASRESGAFLNALPSPALGTFLDDGAFRIAIALRLGVPICQPHTCVCGCEVDELGTHGLSCRKSAGRMSRHAAVNDIIKRGLVSAGFPVIQEPSFLTRDNNKRPDGVTQIPWVGGKSLVWDFTCVNSLATSYVEASSKEPLHAATGAETSKRRKYAHLNNTYFFAPIAAECLGSLGKDSLKLIDNIGRKIAEATGEKRASEFFMQRISIAIQRGNAASILATIPKEASLEDLINLL